MSSTNSIFASAEKKYKQNEALSFEELACMEQYLSFQISHEAVIACGALLRDASAKNDQKAKARTALMKWISEPLTARNKALLVGMLLFIPLSEITDPMLVKFVYGMTDSASFMTKSNVICILLRMAAQGDKAALYLIQAAESDPSEAVRQQATNALKQAKMNHVDGYIAADLPALIAKLPRNKHPLVYHDSKNYPSIANVRFLADALEEELSFSMTEANFNCTNSKTIVHSMVAMWANIPRLGSKIMAPEGDSLEGFRQFFTQVKAILTKVEE